MLTGFMYYMSHQQTQQPSSPEQVITLIWLILQRTVRSKSYFITSERDFADKSYKFPIQQKIFNVYT